MREALAGLTVRGRAFLAAGVTAIVCAIILGQPALTRVGVLVGALPLVTAAVIGRSRYRLALVRTVNPQLVTAGQPARVNLSLTNEGRTPSGVLLLEDHVPYVLGTRPRFVLEGIGHGWRRHVTYQVRSDVRGQFEIGPMTVRVSDPFGMVELGRAFRPPSRSRSPRAPSRCRTIPLGGRLDRVRRQPPARVRDRQRRGRHRPRVPPRRRPAPRPLAQLGPGRRADGAPRGAALAVAGHPLPRQPAPRPPRPGHRLLARGSGLGRGVDRGPPEPPRLHGAPGHRVRGGPDQRLALPRRRAQHRPAARGAGGRAVRSRARGSRPTGSPSPPTAG